MVAEFESDLIRMRTREGMKVAKARGRLWGMQPKLTLSRRPTSSLCTGPVSTPTAELAELFSVGRSTVYRALERAQARTPA